MSKLSAIAVVALTAGTAHAEPTPEVAGLTETARNVASAGRCPSLEAIGRRVRELDPAYYADVFARDPVIAGCFQAAPRVPEAGAPPGLTPRSAPVAPPIPAERHAAKSGTVAFLASAVTTAGGCGLFALGEKTHSSALYDVGGLLAFLGPTVGHTYSGKTWNGGLAVRLVGLGATVVGVAMFIGGQQDIGGALFLGGSATYLTGSLYEIATAPEAANEYNRAGGFEPTLTLAAMKTRDGAAPALALAGRF